MKKTKMKKISDNINIRALKFLYGLCPGYFRMTVFNTFIGTLLPYFDIFMSAEIISELSGNRNPKRTLILIIITLAGNLLIGVFRELTSRFANILSRKFDDSESAAFNDKTLSLDYSDLEEPNVRQLRRKIIESAWIDNHGKGLLMSDFFWLVGYFSDVIMAFIFCLGMVISVIINCFNPMTTLLLILFIAATAAGVMYQKTAMDKLSDLWNSASRNMIEENRISGEMNDYNLGKDIRLYNLADFYERVGKKIIRDNRASFTKLQNKRFLVDIPTDVISLVKNCALYLLVSLCAIRGVFGAGSVIKYVSAVQRLSDAVTMIIYYLNDIRSNTPFVEDYMRYFDLPRKMYQGSLPIEKRAFCNDGDYDYKIEFRDVSFKYPGCEEYALRHLNLTFKIGERLAVVGRNGSGKTTFIKLLCRLYDPTEGRILLNGIDISKYDYDEYMRVFTVVFQDFRLFSFRLSENVAAGLEIDEKYCEKCLEEVGFGDKLEELPEGINTYLYKNFDKNGIEISGGEAQKIALARALYKNAPFIILDEPTAALDPISEAAIYEQFNGIVGNKTAVYISHRLASCRFCDEIAVFDGGKIVEMGTHEGLIAQDGKYRELWDAQAGYYQKSENR